MMKVLLSFLAAVLCIVPGCGLDKRFQPVDVVFETSKGEFTIQVHPDWAPLGSERFLELVRAGFYDGCRFFRMMPDFVAQVGINGDPAVHAQWNAKPIKDDPVMVSNSRGAVTFATTGKDSRTPQIFFNFKHNPDLDGRDFAPFGVVRGDGMKGIDALNAEYRGAPDQHQIEKQGNAYLEREFPRLDYIKRAYVK